MGVPGKTEGTIFSPIPCEVILTGPERVGGRRALNKRKPSFGVKICWIFVRGHYLFWEANSIVRAYLEEIWELWGTDNGQISKLIFASDGGYCVYYPLNIFAPGTVLKIEEYNSDIPRFSWGIFSHVMHLDQLGASKNIWWILINDNIINYNPSNIFASSAQH